MIWKMKCIVHLVEYRDDREGPLSIVQKEYRNALSNSRYDRLSDIQRKLAV